MEKLKLKIISTQMYETHEDVQESVVEATVGERNDAYYILFKETDCESGIVTSNSLKIKDNAINLKRNGGLETALYFDIKKEYRTIYRTPYNEMDITIKTHNIEKNITEGHITLRLHYTILMQGKKISDNIYMITNCVEKGGKYNEY